MVKHILFRFICWAVVLTCCLANTEILNFRTRRNAASRGSIEHGVVSSIIPLIPGRANRTSISLPSPDALQYDENTATTIEYSVQLDEYLQRYIKSGSWLCKVLVGGCNIDTEKAWTARISWPATTPASFNISITQSKQIQGHDRILRVDLRRTGVLIPAQSVLSIFNRRSNNSKNQTGTSSSSNQTIRTPVSTINGSGSAGEALVFDIIVEPLLFWGGVLPMGSWYTAVAIVGTLVVGPLVAGGLMRGFVESGHVRTG